MNIRNIYILLFTTDAKNVDSATKSLLTCIVASILQVLSLNLSNFALIISWSPGITIFLKSIEELVLIGDTGEDYILTLT